MKYRGLPAIAAVLGLSVLLSAQSAQTPRLKVSSGVAEGLKVHADSPHYPQEARKQGIEGDVILRATIDTKGHISDLKVVAGNSILADAAVQAVKHWKYRPYVLNGQPVEVETAIKVQFRL